jgi:hypothetical protein
MVFGFMVFYPLAKKLSDDDWFLPDFWRSNDRGNIFLSFRTASKFNDHFSIGILQRKRGVEHAADI